MRKLISCVPPPMISSIARQMGQGDWACSNLILRYNILHTWKPAPLRLPCVIYYASSTPADTLLFDAPHESLIIVRSVYTNNVDYWWI